MLQVPLPQLTTAWKDIIADLKKQDGTDFLPSTYTPEQINGWRRQRDLLAASYASLESSVTEIPFSGGATTSLVLQRQASRGTVVLNTTDKYAEPIVDYFTNINPVDRRIGVEMLRFYRKYMAWPSHQVRAPIELAPGANVTSDEGIAEYFANGMISGIGHSCCTAALGPKELGGVLSPELLVHGVTGLSVGDISLIPLIPATHTCATVYAIAEKVRVKFIPYINVLINSHRRQTLSSDVHNHQTIRLRSDAGCFPVENVVFLHYIIIRHFLFLEPCCVGWWLNNLCTWKPESRRWTVTPLKLCNTIKSSKTKTTTSYSCLPLSVQKVMEDARTPHCDALIPRFHSLYHHWLLVNP